MTFKTGESGNPKGRPQGSGHRQQLFKNLVEPHAEAMFDIAIKLALGGNEKMLMLFLEKLLPAKPADDAVCIGIEEGSARKADVLLYYGEKILSAISRGEITPEQGRSLMAVVESQRKNIETSDLATRMAEIERILKQRKQEKKLCAK
jgi:hypothetical protein